MLATTKVMVTATSATLSARGSMMRPSWEVWLSLRATNPSIQSVQPMMARTKTPQPYSCRASTSHTNRGVPRNLTTVMRLGMVRIAWTSPGVALELPDICGHLPW